MTLPKADAPDHGIKGPTVASWPGADRLLLAALFAPAVLHLWPLLAGAPWRAAIGPSGETAARLLVIALSIAPLRMLFPAVPLLAWMERRRRWIGLAAFGYAVVHLSVFLPSVGRFDWILQGMAFASMWTGWLAFALLLAVAAISNDAARARFGRGWKRLQRLVWPAAALALAHWLLLSRDWTAALLTAMPLATLQAARLWMRLRRSSNSESGDAGRLV